MTTRIDVLITDPTTGAVVARFNARHRGFADMRIARYKANDADLIAEQWPTVKAPRVPLRLPSQRSPR